MGAPLRWSASIHTYSMAFSIRLGHTQTEEQLVGVDFRSSTQILHFNPQRVQLSFIPMSRELQT